MGTKQPANCENLAANIERRMNSTVSHGQFETLQSGLFDQRLFAAGDVVEAFTHG